MPRNPFRPRPRQLLLFNDAYDVLEIVRDGSDGWYQALCPAHDDHRASLGVKEGEEGQLVVYCHAGCSTIEVIKAIKELL